MRASGATNANKEQGLVEEKAFSHNRPVPVSFIDEIRKSVCKIIIDGKQTGTGFFMVINSDKYLITCYHVIEDSSHMKIEIWDKNTFNLKINNYSSNIYKDLDVVLIDTKESNIKNIEYLYYDENCKHGFKQYANLDIFTLSYQFGDELVPTSGKFGMQFKDYQFSHTVDTKRGSSGCPIILFTKKVIGIHEGYRKNINSNIAIFIGKIVDVLNKNIKNENKLEYKNNLLDDNFEEKDKNIIEFNKEFNLNINPHITKLDLSWRSNKCLEYLPKLKLLELKELYLWYNKISDIKFLEKVKFEKLEILSLGWNKNISNYYILEKVNFKELKELSLGANNISDIKFLEKVKFEKLEKLNLNRNKISDCNILEKVNFKELKELDLSGNNKSDIKFLEKIRVKLPIIYY